MPRSLRQPKVRSSLRFISESLEQRTLLSTAGLDPNFGTGGEVLAALGGTNPVAAQAVATDANGKIIVAAEDGRDATVLRYLPNGKLDPNFGTAGKKTIDFGSGHVAESLSMSIQTDGRILVAGNDFTSLSKTNEAFVFRLNTNGSLDSTFGSAGESIFNLGANDGHYVIAALSSGKMIVATDGTATSTNGTFVAKRLSANGSTDTTFGAGGLATVKVGLSPTISGIVIQSDGNIVLGGTVKLAHNAGNSIQLARLTTSGTPDTTYGSGGAAMGKDTAVINDAIVLEPSDGRIIAAGAKGASSFYLERFNVNGTIDSTFGGTDGVNTTFAGSKIGQISGLAVQGNGRIVAVGTVDGVLTVARYQSNGKLDSTFGTNGITTTAFESNTTDEANAVALQSSGRIVVAGSVTSIATKAQSVGIVRYLGDHAVLTAGQSQVTTGTTNVADPRLIGTVAASQTLSFSSGSGSSAVHGQVQEWVEQETGTGTLDFYYRIVDTSGPAAGIVSLIASNFAGFSTYVDYRPDSAGTIAPVTASRSSDNKSITFSFLPAPNGNGNVTPGIQSFALFVKTDATSYNTAGKVLLNGSISLAGYEPAVPTAGKIDPSFGDAGFAGGDPWSPEMSALQQINGIVAQSDGRIVVGSSTGNIATIARFTADGDLLDKTFGTDGMIRDFDYVLSAIGLQSNGDIIAVGGNNSTDALLVRRYTVNGKLDTTFGTNGTIQTTVAGGQITINAVKILGNDEILVAGSFYKPSTNTQCPIVVRYTSAGKIDTTFAAAGIDILATLANTEVRAISVQSSGDIILGGTTIASNIGRVSAVRLLSNGTPDSSFGTGGIVTGPTDRTGAYTLAVAADNSILLGGQDPLNGGIVVHFSVNGVLDANFGIGGTFGTAEAVLALTVESDGSILAIQGDRIDRLTSTGQSASVETTVGGNAITLQVGGKYILGGDFHLARITPATAIDPTFGRYGVVNTDLQGFSGIPTGVAVQKDGKILVAGSDFQFDWYVDRYNADGSIDTTFGNGGEVLFKNQGDLAAMVLDSSGRILLAGDINAESAQQAGVVERLNSNGSIDTTFGVNGLFTTPANAFTEFKSIAIQGDGKIVVGGDSFNANQSIGSFNLERLLATGKLDASFGAGGVITTSISGFHDSINSVAIQKDGKIVVAGSAGNSGGGSSFVIARYTPAGKLDTTFGSAGKTIFTIGAAPDYANFSVNQIAIDSQGRIVGAGGIDYFSQGIAFRLTTSGKLDGTFASNGIYDMPNVDSGTGADSILVLPGDKILIGGFTGINEPGPDEAGAHPDLGGIFPALTLVQVNADGTPDLNFGIGGLVVDEPGQSVIPNMDAAHVMALQTNGMIIVAGNDGATGIARFTGP